MKRLIFIFALAFAAVTAAAPVAFGVDPDRGIPATVSAISLANGSGAKYRAKKRWLELKEGSIIKAGPGAAIKTTGNPSLKLALGPLITAVVGADTQIDLESFHFARWEDQAVLRLAKGSVTVTARKDIAHKATAVVMTDRFTAVTNLGKMKLAVDSGLRTVDALSGTVAVTEQTTGTLHQLAAGRSLTADDQLRFWTSDSTASPWPRRLVWLLLVPLALFIRNFLNSRGRSRARLKAWQ